MPVGVDHLHALPALLPATATLIYGEFWAEKDGYSPAYFEQRLSEASAPGRLPICRVAHEQGVLLGTANLIDNDDEARGHLWPWLAAVVVVPEARGRGIGALLVSTILGDAAAMGIDVLHLGTDKPEFYALFGATPLEKARPDLWIMRCPTKAPE